MGVKIKASLVFLFATSLGFQALGGAPKLYSLDIRFSTLEKSQQILLQKYCALKSLAESTSDCWQTLSVSQKSTFFAVTHGLMHSSLGDGLSGLDLVDSVSEISGENDGTPSSKQFNLAVRWRAEAWAWLGKSKFRRRSGSDHPGELGWGEGRSGYRGAHLLFEEKDLTVGHVHIDYRPVSWVRVLQRYAIHSGSSHGHFDAYNADVRAIGPEKDPSDGGTLYDNLALHQNWYGSLGVLSALAPATVDSPPILAKLQVFVRQAD